MFLFLLQPPDKVPHRVGFNPAHSFRGSWLPYWGRHGDVCGCGNVVWRGDIMEDYKQGVWGQAASSKASCRVLCHKASPTPYSSHSLQNTTTKWEPGVSEMSFGRRFQIRTKTFSQIQGSTVKFELHDDTILRHLSTPFYALKLLKRFPFGFMCVRVSLACMSGTM